MKKSTLKYDTPVKVFESQQKIKLGVNPDMKLGDYFKKMGYGSLADMMR